MIQMWSRVCLYIVCVLLCDGRVWFSISADAVQYLCIVGHLICMMCVVGPCVVHVCLRACRVCFIVGVSVSVCRAPD